MKPVAKKSLVGICKKCGKKLPSFKMVLGIVYLPCPCENKEVSK